MPDGDIYSKSVPRPWVKVPRLVFGKQDYEGAVTTAVKVLSGTLADTDCVAIGDAIQAIAQSMDTASDLPSRQAVVRNLDQFAGRLPQSHVEALKRVAQRALVTVSPAVELAVPRGVWEEDAICIGVEFLSELTNMSIAAAGNALLAQTGETDTVAIVDQTAKFGEHFRSDPGVQLLASQLVRTPVSLSQRKSSPRVKRARLPQRELLEIAIG